MLGFVIGDSNMVTGFRLVGVRGTEATTLDEAKAAFAQATARTDIAVIIISQQFSQSMQPEIAKTRERGVTPMVVEVPGAVGATAETNLSEIVSKNLGIRV